MSYIPTEWKNGDTITAEKLNHIENGIASAGSGSVLIIGATDENSEEILDKTWKEIHDALSVGIPCVIVLEDENLQSTDVVVRAAHGGSWSVETHHTTYSTDNENGYPSYYYGD